MKNKDNNKTLYLFEDDIIKKISSISNMPSFIINNYAPAFDTSYGEHIASSMIVPGEKTTIYLAKINMFEGIKINTISKRKYVDLITGNFSINEDDDIVIIPSLLGDRAELAIKSGQRNISDFFQDIINKHEQNIYWVKKELYEKLREQSRSGVIAHSRHQIEADEENIRSLIYMTVFFQRKNSRAAEIIKKEKEKQQKCN